MDRKTLTIILAVALIASFFIPLYSFGGSMLDWVKGSGNWQKYLWLLIPISGALLLFGELNSNYPVSRGFLTVLPLLTVLYFIFIGPLINGIKFEYIFKAIGRGYAAGMWIAIVSSIVLAFYNPRPR